MQLLFYNNYGGGGIINIARLTATILDIMCGDGWATLGEVFCGMAPDHEDVRHGELVNSIVSSSLAISSWNGLTDDVPTDQLSLLYLCLEGHHHSYAVPVPKDNYIKS